MARPKLLYSTKGFTPKQLELRDLAMADLRAFVGLVAPQLHIGHAHHDLLRFLMGDDERQLVIWPRGHLKSTLLAYETAWTIIKEPDTTIVYLSATADLAEKQTGLIKTIVDSPIVHKYWPELLPQEAGKRDLWRTSEFNVGHWKRGEEVVRDPTLKAAGITGNITGFHADHIKLDDLVTGDNSETKTSREEIKGKYSYLSSILNAGGTIKAVGTRYHPSDLYEDLVNTEIEIFDDKTGDVIETVLAYTVTQEVVEVDGEFLWPRSRRKDGKWFGFNKSELSKKKADYLDKAKFFAQYYNDPSDPHNKRIAEFNYYDRSHLTKRGAGWMINNNKLSVYAAIDFAATVTKRADYTAIAVVGVDSDHNYYVLDIARFKTDKISVMSDELERLYDKWSWIKLRAECNAQQNLIVEQIKEFNKSRGVYYAVDKVSQVTNKEVRIMTNLEPRYAMGAILHYRGGNCQILEDELMATKSPHDDVSDALASVIEIAKAPSKNRGMNSKVANITYHPKWGGVG
jgi:predicted phage terminase large subunit-like protein